MALLNPVYAFVLPFLCIFTIPLAIFAGITTTLAFSVLMVRVAVVYLDMALAFVPQYILGRSGTYPRSLSANYYQQYGWEQPVSPGGSIGSAVAGGTSRGGSGVALTSGQITSSTGLSYSVPGSASGGAMVSAFAGSGCRSPKHRNPASSLHAGSGSTTMSGGGGGGSTVVLGRRSRRSSQASMVSVSTITPIREAAAEGDTPLPSSSSWCGSASVLANSSGLIPSVGLGRDFEGVGGWRLDVDDDDSDWAKINRRLELPHDRAPSRHHQRRQSASRSGGATTPVETAAGGSGSNTWLMMKSSLRNDGSPEARERERGDRMAGGGGGSGKLNISPNSSRLRINQVYQVPTPLTTIEQQQGESYFPMLVPPKALKKASA